MSYKKKGWKAAGIMVATAVSVALIAPAVKSQSSPTIKIDGSSTVYPITEAVAEEFQIQNQGATQVTVGVSGTGGGFKKFCSEDEAVRTDISNASRQIEEDEIAACEAAGVEYIEIPVAYDALTVVAHPDNPIESMTVEELNKIWGPESEGEITNWSQVNPQWPDAEFSLFGPGADSGTFDSFTKEINGEEGASRTDYTPSEDDNVLVQGVSSDPNGLGYFGYSYYQENKDQLKAIAIDNGNGAVIPSEETVRDGSYQPLSRVVYIYVNAASADKPEVAGFVDFYLTNAEALVPEVGSVPLTAEEYQQGIARFQNKETGTTAAAE
ncbi:phosphate ABC transporter periplasmic phosphate-binding protein [Chondrocystis sp. NIES-4102]|nr:phosphate ABC transporter periplasmic phosphate-binding protein [Chondrocystis sp. NIES-4102]